MKENGKVKKVPVVVSAGYKDVESGGCCPEAENIHRGNWDCWWEFPLVALGFVMNLDSMMRFPGMFQKHGGGRAARDRCFFPDSISIIYIILEYLQQYVLCY